MASKALPTPQYLRQLLRYEPETGKLFWRERPASLFKSERSAANWNSRRAGKEAFTATNGLHLTGRIDDKAHYAHRVIWAMHHGEWPSGVIDHINQNPADNRIANLRDVQRADNQRNQRLRKTNKFGAHWVEEIRPGKWRARIKHDGKVVHLGYFDSIEAAVAARKAAETKYGFHPNHGA